MVSTSAIGSVLDGMGPLGGPATSQKTSEVPFGGMLKSMVDESNELSAKAQTAVTGLLSGTGVDVHEASIATQKADVAFELAMQVRNKAVSAYQTMMGMQF